MPPGIRQDLKEESSQRSVPAFNGLNRSPVKDVVPEMLGVHDFEFAFLLHQGVHFPVGSVFELDPQPIKVMSQQIPPQWDVQSGREVISGCSCHSVV